MNDNSEKNIQGSHDEKSACYQQTKANTNEKIFSLFLSLSFHSKLGVKRVAIFSRRDASV